jgi:hypothetical protein
MYRLPDGREVSSFDEIDELKPVVVAFPSPSSTSR